MNKGVLFELNESEKLRILGLHESATKKLYLKEDIDPSESFETFKKQKPDDIGAFIFKYIVKRNNMVTPEAVKNYLSTIETTYGRKGRKLIQLIQGVQKQDFTSGGGTESFTNVGSFLLKNEKLLESVYNFLKQNNVMLRMTY